MSRIIVDRYPSGKVHFVVGWDHPASGAFWQEYATQDEVTEAERKIAEAERTGIGPHSETVAIVETGVKREGGMWPGIALANFKAEVPEDLRPLVTDRVMNMLFEHTQDPDSGYVGAPHRGQFDLTK